MQSIYTYIPETNYVPREYSVAAILLLLFMVLVSLVPVLILLLLLLLLLLRFLLSQAFFRWYVSLTSGGPHSSGFKFQAAILSVLCDVPSTAVFCTESTEYFPDMPLRFFFKSFFTIPMVSIIASIIIHFMFHIRFISIHKILYLISFLFPSAWHFCPLALRHLSVSTFPLFRF